MKSDFLSGGFGYGDFKKRLFEAFWDYFQPMREKRNELSENLDYVDSILKKGAEKARNAQIEHLQGRVKPVELNDVYDG